MYSTTALHPTVGTEFRGIDLSHTPDETDLRAVRETLADRGLILLRNQKLTPQAFVEFCRGLGTLRTHDLAKFRVDGAPELTILSNIVDDAGQAIGFVDVGRVWHTDASFTRKPHMFSCLYAIEIPSSDAGPLGDTAFVSTQAAFESLSSNERERIAKLRGIHRFGNRYSKFKEVTGKEALKDSFAARAELPDVVHPVVRTHPLTGRKSIYVNELFTVGIEDMPQADSTALLAELCSHCTRDSGVYRHKWQVGDVLVWDNCATQHIAYGDYALPQRRLLYKATTEGTEPF